MISRHCGPGHELTHWTPIPMLLKQGYVVNFRWLLGQPKQPGSSPISTGRANSKSELTAHAAPLHLHERMTGFGRRFQVGERRGWARSCPKLGRELNAASDWKRPDGAPETTILGRCVPWTTASSGRRQTSAGVCDTLKLQHSAYRQESQLLTVSITVSFLVLKRHHQD
jgi:hypothetical protein